MIALRTRRNSRARRGDIDVQIVADVDQHRLRTELDDDVGRRAEGRRGHDDLVAGTDTQRVQGNLEPGGAGIHGDRLRRSDVLGEIGLEALDLRPHGDPAGSQ